VAKKVHFVAGFVLMGERLLLGFLWNGLATLGLRSHHEARSLAAL
jgi:hypothetical protein